MPVQAIAGKRSAKLWMVPFAALLIVAAIVVPPLVSLNRLHSRIAESISRAIGRPVRMSSIKLRLLPRPGFEIADFVVEEDPSFGAEPILRSAQVIASVRLLPLWRGRLEIARIAFDEPSVNLVRNREGRWNFDTLLSQAAQIPKAPTGERHPGGMPRFPYIDASNARINFKSGDEKLPFSFFNADLAVWLENPGEWRIEFAAQPVRTDLSLDLANTGIFRLVGSLRHAAALRDMPMQLHAEWANAPLGQLSKIITGSDADWRGQLDAAADITGSIEHASVKLTAIGQRIHRVEFAPRTPLNINITCRANFTRAGLLLDELTCLSPAGEGHLLLTGSVHASATASDPHLVLELNHLPVSWALDGLRLLRAGFGGALDTAGTINGSFTYASPDGAAENNSPPQLRGQATVDQLAIAGSAPQKPLALPTLHFVWNPEAPQQLRRERPLPAPSAHPDELLLEPFVIGSPAAAGPAEPTPALKLPSAITVSGAFSSNGFSIHLGGESRLPELVALGKQFGIFPHLPVDFGTQGTADLDLNVLGPWMLPVSEQPAAPASLNGTLRLRNAQLSSDFLAQPLQIPTAQAVFSANEINWAASGMIYGPLHADGTLAYPAFCTVPTGCAHQFSLHLATLDADTAQIALLGAQRQGEIIQRLLDRLRNLNQTSPAWPRLTGSVQIGTLTIQSLTVKELTAAVAVEGHAFELKSATGRALDGQLHASGALVVSDHTPHYQIDARIDDANARSVAGLFAENWGPGSISLSTSLKAAGFEQKALLSSAAGAFHWDWDKGALPASASLVTARNSSNLNPLSRFDEWTAEGVIANQTLHLQKSQVVRPTGLSALSGTITFARELDLSTGDTANQSKITGTLQRPLIENTTRAAPDAPTPK